jgi:hypothetical protein
VGRRGRVNSLKRVRPKMVAAPGRFTLPDRSHGRTVSRRTAEGEGGPVPVMMGERSSSFGRVIHTSTISSSGDRRSWMRTIAGSTGCGVDTARRGRGGTVDAGDSKSPVREYVSVRIRPPAPAYLATSTKSASVNRARSAGVSAKTELGDPPAAQIV